MAESKQFQMDGYRFLDKSSYDIASLEKQKIDTIKQSISADNPESIKAVYETVSYTHLTLPTKA